MSGAQPMLTRAALKERGWTDTLIRRYLGEPDALKRNPHYRSAAPVQLYILSRVEGAEATPEFQNASEKSRRRREGAKRAADTKRVNLLGSLEAAEVEVPEMPRDRLVRAACDHYNDHQSARGRWDFDSATPDSTPTFIERITVNYLRHSLTDYEHLLGDLFGCVGREEGYILIKGRILDAIAAKHPWLAGECARQKGVCCGGEVLHPPPSEVTEH